MKMNLLELEEYVAKKSLTMTWDDLKTTYVEVKEVKQ